MEKWKRHFVITTFANWTPPWSKWIVAMLSEWISWMKKFGTPRPIPSPSYHPGQPHWQRNRWLGWKWVLMTKWRNDEMTFSTSDLGEKSFKEIVYINIYIYYFFDPNTVFQNVISSFRHYVITSLTSFVQNHHKNRRNLLNTCSLQRQKGKNKPSRFLCTIHHR